MNPNKFPMCFIVRYRLTPLGMSIDRHIIRYLSWWLFKGNEVTWAFKRNQAYILWMAEINFKKELDIPDVIGYVWVKIWESYNNAFGGYNHEELQNADGRSN